MRTFFQFAQAMQPGVFAFQQSQPPDLPNTHVLTYTHAGIAEQQIGDLTLAQLMQLRQVLLQYLNQHGIATPAFP
jgi:hypothetical protein